MLHAINLTCESRRNPLGIDEPRPRFSWQITFSRFNLNVLIHDAVDLHHQGIDVDVLTLFLHLPLNGANRVCLAADIVADVVPVQIFDQSADLSGVCVELLLRFLTAAHGLCAVRQKGHLFKTRR